MFGKSALTVASVFCLTLCSQAFAAAANPPGAAQGNPPGVARGYHDQANPTARGERPSSRPATPAQAPELDGAGAILALGLLAGLVAVLRERKLRVQRNDDLLVSGRD